MSKSAHIIYLVIILILLAVIAGGFYHYHNQTAKAATQDNHPMMFHQGQGTASGSAGMQRMSMTPASPPPLSEQQNQELSQGTSTTSTQKTFNITGGNFYFVPNKITVNKGDTVTFVFTNGGGMHNLVIDELGVKIPTIQSGQTQEATFTASKTGTFTYYCTIPGHREKGMSGTLVVQ